MTAFRFAGFYPAQFNTPLGSAIVAPGQVVEWPDDGPPNEGHGWVETPDAEPTPFEELGPHDESADEPAEETVQAEENMPENIPAAPDTPDAAGDETITDTVSPQATDTATGDTTDQPDSAPAPKRAPRSSNK